MPSKLGMQVGPAAGFATSAACRDCHPHQHASWHQSFHRTMTQQAEPATVLAPLDDVRLELDAQTYRLTREGDTFWADMPNSPARAGRSDPARSSARTAGRLKREIVMLTGSHHTQAFWTQANGELQQVPFVYHLQVQRWIPKRDSFLNHDRRPDPRDAVWNQICIQCHSVAGSPGYSPGAVQTHVVELGIGCEACHGPGAGHVARHQPRDARNVPAFQRFDDSIVNPALLSHERSAQVCGRCHSFFYPQDVREWFAHGFTRSYQPGGKLFDAQIPILPGDNDDSPHVQRYIAHSLAGLHNLYWPDGSVLVGGREFLGLLQSPCYQRGEMTCLSCHSMHDYQDADDQLAVHRNGNAACLQCHPSYRDALEQHTHHAAESSGSQCANCHMPHTSYALFKGIRNHRITSPRVEPTLKTHRPNACNLCHLDRTREWAGNHLTAWYGQPAVDVEPDCRNIADGVLWMLKGNAPQRAVATYAMGSASAQSASGRDWMVPFLADRLTDPYSPVRLIAYRALRTIPGFEDWPYDFLAPADDLEQTKHRLLAAWASQSSPPSRHDPQHVLLTPAGSLLRDTYDRLVHERDEQPFTVSE
jgi:hypothetical protein